MSSGQNYAQNHGNGFLLQIMMCGCSPHVLAMFSLVVQRAEEAHCSRQEDAFVNCVQFRSVHYRAFFTVTNVRLLGCLTLFAPLVARVS